MDTTNNRPLIGMIGGTGWASTVEYYRLLNEKVNERLGGLNFVRCLLYSLNFGDINELNNKRDYRGIYALILDAAKSLKAGGAGYLVLGANTLHQYAEELERDMKLPVIHIAEATAKAIKAGNFAKAGLMGTRQTMEMDFYKDKLNNYGIEVILPDPEDREYVDTTIRGELVKGIFLPETNVRYIEIMNKLAEQGAECIIMGCTEIPLLVKQEQTSLKLFDTLEIHAGAIVDYYLG